MEQCDICRNGLNCDDIHDSSICRIKKHSSDKTIVAVSFTANAFRIVICRDCIEKLNEEIKGGGERE